MSTPGPLAEPCPRCGVIARPTLLPGTGPHACKAVCSSCGRFIKWISLHAPAEQMARHRHARLQAMQKLAPSEAQLSFWQALGDTGAAPASMAEASERIERLKGA
jgi:hypothetical protein